jgi:paraquat-inducible protein A
MATGAVSLRAAGDGAPMAWSRGGERPAVTGPRLSECHDCGLHNLVQDIAPGSRAVCRRCGATLLRIPVNSLDRSLALAIGGLVLVVVANTLPFMSLSIQGRLQQASLVTGAIALFDQGFWSLAAVVTLSTIVAPALKLGATVYVVGGLRLAHPPRDLPLVLRWMRLLHPWAMVEVYLLGVFVAYVKLVDLATIEIGLACYSLAGLMVLMVAIDAVLCPDLLWREMERRSLVRHAAPAGSGRAVLCETCGITAPPIGHACSRCGGGVHRRKPEAIARSWALCIAALILYIPANIFPVMTVISFGAGAPSTIIGGTKELFAAGMWPLALLVFFASVTVPVLKLAGLMFLLVATQRGARWRLRDRTVLYRIIETIGRWSMIDIFMLSILAGLVRLGSVATIEPGAGAISFAAVVIITILAAMTFDPRLMWDVAGENPWPRR